ncbi:hypothetical protein V8E53_006864 [Lactarius tabidus]
MTAVSTGIVVRIAAGVCASTKSEQFRDDQCSEGCLAVIRKPRWRTAIALYFPQLAASDILGPLKILTYSSGVPSESPQLVGGLSCFKEKRSGATSDQLVREGVQNGAARSCNRQDLFSMFFSQEQFRGSGSFAFQQYGVSNFNMDAPGSWGRNSFDPSFDPYIRLGSAGTWKGNSTYSTSVSARGDTCATRGAQGAGVADKAILTSERVLYSMPAKPAPLPLSPARRTKQPERDRHSDGSWSSTTLDGFAVAIGHISRRRGGHPASFSDWTTIKQNTQAGQQLLRYQAQARDSTCLVLAGDNARHFSATVTVTTPTQSEAALSS